MLLLLAFRVCFHVFFVGFYGLYHAYAAFVYAAFVFCCLVLLAKCYAFSFRTLTLVPLQDFVPRCIYFMYCALVEC